MARTKKELQDQIPEEAQIVADASLTESEQLPQTDLEQPASALADLELAATNTLDPDAPQTDLELSEETDDDQAAMSQTDFNPDEETEEITDPDRGLAETPELWDEGVEQTISGVYEPEELQQSGSILPWIAAAGILLAAGIGGFLFWKRRKKD